MTSQAEESKHITPEMCAVLRYLGAARLLERQGLIVLQHCLSGDYAARLTPAGAEVLSTWRSCAEGAASWGRIERVRIWKVGVA